MDLNFALPMYGLWFAGSTAIFNPVKAAMLFSAKSRADDFVKASGVPVQVVRLSEAQLIRKYLKHAKGRGGSIVLFDTFNMPRFKLRTLLIVLAIAGMVFARIAYLKRLGDFHHREVHRLIQAITKAEGGDNRIANSLNDFAIAGETIGTVSDSTRTKIGIHNSHFVRWVKDESSVELWRSAIYHQILANRYQAAMYRPWTVVVSDQAPHKRIGEF
jgi:hypothetical protein